MKTQEDLNKEDGIISILDLPEQIFRNIFRHINTHQLVSVVRRINLNMKQYVDEYLHLQGVFVLITKQWMNNNMRNKTRLLYIIKRAGTKFETSLSISKPFPMLDQRPMQNRNTDLYPLLTPSNETQGSLIFEVHSSSYFTHSSAAKVALDLYGFDVEKCNWKLLMRKYANIKSQVI